MISYNKILGLPLFVLDEGKKTGIIHEVVFNIHKKTVEGLIIIEIGKKRSFIRFADVKIFEDKVIINDLGNLKVWDKKDNAADNIVCGKELIKKKVFDFKGDELGYIYDMLLDAEISSVEAFQLTDGIIEDIIEGRKIIPLLGKADIREDGIFVGRESVEEFVDVRKGIKQIFSIDEEIPSKNI